MKITNIYSETIHHVYTDDGHYIRYGPKNWMKRMYYDIMSEDYDVIPEDVEKLEKLFQVEMELEELIKTEV
jgi:hypothetical protein